ncbi:alpha/beta hydrolase [Streptomyces sp. NPDC001507]|uniref:alpha/beta hydrolase n=1 Tax=Streptomyces sp. NPDC001507 TaxID=3364579 RepID=UPI0036C3EDE4
MGKRSRAAQGLRYGCAFVGVDNGGHYVYNDGFACIDEATLGFLATGRLPDIEGEKMRSPLHSTSAFTRPAVQSKCW